MQHHPPALGFGMPSFTPGNKESLASHPCHSSFQHGQGRMRAPCQRLRVLQSMVAEQPPVPVAFGVHRRWLVKAETPKSRGFVREGSSTCPKPMTLNRAASGMSQRRWREGPEGHGQQGRGQEGRGQEWQGQVVRRPCTSWYLDAQLTRGTLASRRLAHACASNL